MGRDAADGGVADGVVAAQHHRERAGGVDVRDGLGDLVERLLDVAGDGEDVAQIGDRDGLAQVDAQLEAVGPVQGGDLADALRAEAGARAVGGAAVERRAQHGDVELAAAPHVLDVGGLEERVDAGEVGQLAAGERRDAPIDDGVGALQTQLQAAGDLLLPFRGGQAGLGGDGERGLGPVVRVDLRFVRVVVQAVLLTVGAPAESSRHHQLSPGLLSRRGGGRAATCVSRTRPPASGDGTLDAPHVCESGRSTATRCCGCTQLR